MSRIIEEPNINKKSFFFKMKNYRWVILISPALILIFVFFAIPMINLIKMGFLKYDRLTMYKDIFTLENFVKFFSDPYYFNMIFNSLKVGIYSTILALIIAYPIAHYLTKIKGWERTIISAACLLPIFVSIVVSTLGWWIILLPRGVLSQALRASGLIERSFNMLNNFSSLILVLAHLHLPYAILILASGIQNIPEEKLNAARILGASPIKVFQKITLPLAMPAIASSAILIFALTISSYLIPILITGQTLRLLPMAIYSYTTDLLNWPFAAMVAVILLVIVAILVYGLIALTNHFTKRGKWEMV